MAIREEHVDLAIPNSFSDLDQSLIDAYVQATIETRRGNIFKEVLAACALADQDDLGRFSAASVEAPLSEVLGRETKTPAFAFHLNELCGKERGSILQKSGRLGSFRFRFVEPMIQPYIIMKSLASKVINERLMHLLPVRSTFCS
jgi:hypothetical protein